MLDGIEIDVADPYRDSAKLNYLRGIIFGGEQGISFKDEYASEAGSIFILAQHEGEPVGLIRFRPFKIGKNGRSSQIPQNRFSVTHFQKGLGRCRNDGLRQRLRHL